MARFGRVEAEQQQHAAAEIDREYSASPPGNVVGAGHAYRVLARRPRP